MKQNLNYRRTTDVSVVEASIVSAHIAALDTRRHSKHSIKRGVAVGDKLFGVLTEYNT